MIFLIGTIVVTALVVYKVDDFLKVWSVIGTLVGVVTGAVPSYFFSRAAASSRVAAEQARQGQADADARAQTVLGFSNPDVLEKALAARPDLFKPQAGST
jgi:hypothetical protein